MPSGATDSLAVVIFLLTYVTVAAGRLPFFRIDRTGAAVVGASLMVATGAVTLDEANRSIDLNTIVLLFGMMIVVANLRLSGFFRLVSARAARHVRRPWLLLLTIIGVTGLFSAFFVNDTICLAMAPLVYEITSHLKRNPTPYLLAVAMASNVGSVATITGNPQNILIGSFSQIPYRDFASSLVWIALTGLLLTAALLLLAYRREFSDLTPIPVDMLPEHVNRALLWKSIVVASVMIVMFFLGQPVAKVAIVAGGFLLLTRRVKPEKFYREINFSLLTLFAGLFVVVAGLEKTSAFAALVVRASHLSLNRVPVLSLVTAALSNLVSNVPAVLILKSFVARLAEPHRAWLALAMSSTLAGNFTITGSVANLIVVEKAAEHKIHISFWEYFRVGAPLTIVTIGAGILLLG